jgi:hypothetical protein
MYRINHVRDKVLTRIVVETFLRDR